MPDETTTTQPSPTDLTASAPTEPAPAPTPPEDFAADPDGVCVTSHVVAPEGTTIHEVIRDMRTDDVVDLLVDEKTQTAFFKRLRIHVDPNVSSESGATS